MNNLKNKKSLFSFLIFLVFLCPLISSCKKNITRQSHHKTSYIKIPDKIKEEPLYIKDTICSFKGFPLKSDTIKLIFKGKPLQLELPIYNDKNRYYIPISELISKLNGKITHKDHEFIFVLQDRTIILNVAENHYKKDVSDKPIKLNNTILLQNDIVYISLFDLTRMLDLKTLWHTDKNEILLFYNKEKMKSSVTNKNPLIPALIRLEDIAAAQRYDTSERLEKLRIIADYLYSKGTPFHVAWVPRYIDKSKNIDNDVSKTYSMYNSDFVFTLDYFISKGGLIGLHGYTHQFKDGVSINGTEFSGRANSNEKSTRERLSLAINCAKDLNIPYTFFESPHYGATESQHKIMEEYFSYIYEHFKSNKETVITKCQNINNTIYIPTPLDYVDGKDDVNNMIDKIEALPSSSLASFFYHPSIEFEFIKLSHSSDNYPSYEYSENSVLHQLIKAFDKKGCSFIPITDLK